MQKIFQNGNCDFGDHCKFSHKNLNELKQKAQEKMKQDVINIDNINNWLEKWKKTRKISLPKDENNYELPRNFPAPCQLPPSLQPPINGLQLGDVEWG